MSFKPAVKEKLKARIALEGPSGSGKTYAALRIARGLVGPEGKIAVIDTEKDSAKLYADEFVFDHAPISEPYTPEKYVALIRMAEKEGYECLIIDSITHEWAGDGGILDIKTSTPGNEFTAWGKVTPRHNDFVNAMLNCKCHIIATMRSKQAYAMEQNDKGKQVPKKLGMQAQQREGLDYEFTAVLKIDISHMACGDKDRTKLFPVDSWFLPTEETGKALASWLDSGAEPTKIEENPQPSNKTNQTPEPTSSEQPPIQTGRFKCQKTGKFAPAFCPICPHKESCDKKNPSISGGEHDYTFYVRQVDKLESANAVIDWHMKNGEEAQENLSAEDYEKLKSYVSQLVDIFNKDK